MAQSSDLFLAVFNAGVQAMRRDLHGPLLSIGRAPECDVQLESTRVSRRHAELSCDAEGRWRVRDLGSRNGTRVNGQPISEQTIQIGDHIEIGGFELVMRSRSVEDGVLNTIWSSHEGATTVFTTLAAAPAPRIDQSHLALVSALGERLLDVPDPQQRMTLLCRTLVEPLFRCDSAAVLRVDRADAQQPPQMLCPLQLRIGSAPSLGPATPAQVPRPVVEAAIASQQPILSGGEQSEHDLAAIVCPLHVETSQADVLYVTVGRQHGTVDWLALVALAAEQFKKAQLQIEARQNVQANAALHHDLQKARQMQMSLVPKNPAVPGLEIAIGFEPCRWVGGDYANVLPAADGNIFLAIADVSGKGMAAAMIASGVHSMVHSAIRAGTKLEDLARSLNQFLLESMDRQSFVTMIGALFDPRTGKAQCVNAGHPPMLIVSADGSVQQTRYGHNPPLGVMPLDVELDWIELQPGQLLAMFTDGLSELRDTHGKMLGLDGIEQRLSALYRAAPQAPLNDLCDQLNRALDEIRGPVPATDDRTFLLARREGRGE